MLITLGVIGVVAAITVPTLIQQQREKATVTALKKSYSTLSQAYRLAVAENGTPENWNLISHGSQNGAANGLDKLIPFLRVNKYCRGERGCFPNTSYKYLNGEESSNYYNYFSNSNNVRAALADGSSLSFSVWDPNCNYSSRVNLCGWLTVDINGSKKPNQIGVDLFYFYLLKEGIFPSGNNIPSKNIFSFSDHCRDKSKGLIEGSGPNGHGCAAWVLYNENMDYLHCDDLSWTGKRKCS